MSDTITDGELAILRGAWIESQDSYNAHVHTCRRWDNCRTCDNLSRKELQAFDTFVNTADPEGKIDYN